MGNKQGGGGHLDNPHPTKRRDLADVTSAETNNGTTSPEIILKQSSPPPSSSSALLSFPVQPPPPPPPPPLPLPIRRPSDKLRPRGVADMEIKAHCEKIKRILGSSRLSQMDLLQLDIIITFNDESIIYECFVSIIQIAQNCAPLDGSVLDDYLITCHAMRMNQPNLASKFALLMTQARELIEELIVPADGMGTKASLVLQRSTSSLLLPPSRRSGKDSTNKDSLGSDSVIPKLTKMTTAPQLVKDLENFLNCSQHSTDYGFLDLSAHFASPGISQHGSSQHGMADAITAMKHQYDVARAELAAVDNRTESSNIPSSSIPPTVGPPTIRVTTIIVPNTLGQGTSTLQ